MQMQPLQLSWLLCSSMILLLAAAAAAAPGLTTAATRKLVQTQPAEGSESNPKKYSMNVTVGTLAPDCVPRKVILVNGEYQPKFTFTQGDWVEVTVYNNIPGDWPAVSNGISIHWHGFSLKGQQWMDGTRFVSQCPVQVGASFTYKLQVNEMPGSYFYHDHSSLNRADGLQGPLIVEPAAGTPSLLSPGPDASAVLFLTDHWHFTGNALAMRLNRPFDPSQASEASGGWCWVGLPRSLLINGKGNYQDCEDVYTRQVNGTLPSGNTTASKDVMAPNACVAGQLGPTAEPSTCAVKNLPAGATACAERSVTDVKPGQTTRLRIINAATLVYMTVCIQQHTLTVVAQDAAPVAAQDFCECVDVNTGQRVDVLLKADQPGKPKSYWINVGSQYRKGAPSAYGILRYAGSQSPPNPADIIQPGAIVDRKWNTSVYRSFKPHQLLLAADAASKPKSAAYVAPKAPLTTFKMPSQPVRRFVLQSTQPLIESNGILRWALDNIAHPTAPPCKPILDEVYDNVKWAADNALSPQANGPNQALYFTPMGGNASTWEGPGKPIEVIDGASALKDTVLQLGRPGAATHTISLRRGELVEIVIQNDRAGLYGGEYASANDTLTNKRNGREQHSFHLHGHHFWEVGMGMGEWTADKVNSAEYNLVNPPLRDTTTVLFNGTTEDRAAWVAIRFVADNPGVWPLHCHIAWHEFMGQGVAIIEDAEGIAAAVQPAGMPACPDKCTYSFANFNPKAAQQKYGSSGLLAPDDKQLP